MKGEFKELAKLIDKFSKVTISVEEYSTTFHFFLREEFEKWLDAFKRSLDDQTVNGIFIPKQNLLEDIEEAKKILKR